MSQIELPALDVRELSAFVWSGILGTSLTNKRTVGYFGLLPESVLDRHKIVDIDLEREGCLTMESKTLDPFQLRQAIQRRHDRLYPERELMIDHGKRVAGWLTIEQLVFVVLPLSKKWRDECAIKEQWHLLNDVTDEDALGAVYLNGTEH